MFRGLGTVLKFRHLKLRHICLLMVDECVNQVIGFKVVCQILTDYIRFGFSDSVSGGNCFLPSIRHLVQIPYNSKRRPSGGNLYCIQTYICYVPRQIYFQMIHATEAEISCTDKEENSIETEQSEWDTTLNHTFPLS